jgi:hypothetical protein
MIFNQSGKKNLPDMVQTGQIDLQVDILFTQKMTDFKDIILDTSSGIEPSN